MQSRHIQGAFCYHYMDHENPTKTTLTLCKLRKIKQSISNQWLLQIYFTHKEQIETQKLKQNPEKMESWLSSVYFGNWNCFALYEIAHHALILNNFFNY